MSWDEKRIKPVAPARRVVTAHDPSDTDGTNVQIYDTPVQPLSILDGGAYHKPLYSHLGVPSTNTHTLSPSELDSAADAVKGVVLPNGANGQVTDLAPGFKVEYHRTSSVDYNIFVEGSCTLITPTPGGGEKRTEVKAGDIVIQRGTLHAWEAGPQGARWYTVVVSALPVKVGEEEGKELPDVDF